MSSISSASGQAFYWRPQAQARSTYCLICFTRCRASLTSAFTMRASWRRITAEGTSWRFNRYAERAAEDRHWAKAAADAQVLLDLKA